MNKSDLTNTVNRIIENVDAMLTRKIPYAEFTDNQRVLWDMVPRQDREKVVKMCKVGYRELK